MSIQQQQQQQQQEQSLKKKRDFHVMVAKGGLGFKSAHVLINMERIQRARHTLQRSIILDQLCLVHAKALANQCHHDNDTANNGQQQRQQVRHSVATIDELKQVVQSDQAGENVQCGISVERMHHEAMKCYPSKQNIVGKDFLEFGLAIVKGSHDDLLYMVQLFRGTPWITAPKKMNNNNNNHDDHNNDGKEKSEKSLSNNIVKSDSLFTLHTSTNDDDVDDDNDSFSSSTTTITSSSTRELRGRIR